MSTNLSRESRYASVLWIEGAPYTLEQLAAIAEETASAKKPHRGDNLLKEATLENTKYIENFFGLYFTPEENAVAVCKAMFNFPDFDDMDSFLG